MCLELILRRYFATKIYQTSFSVRLELFNKIRWKIYVKLLKINLRTYPDKL
jgi:hypothetical protein